jgi:plastocyanin
MKRTCWTLGIALVLLMIVMLAARGRTFAAAAPLSTTPAEAAVKIENFSFAPGTITVPVGSTVLWTNKDDAPHNVVSEDKSFKSKAMDTDENFSYTFATPGTYSYHCSIHPQMTGKIVVR